MLVSFDGLGHEILTTDPVAKELKFFHHLRERGATFDGVQPHFPSTTANSHAAIWTGAYGNVNGITFNSHPLLPRSAHAYTEREVGFRSTQLKAEPVWVTAARQGKTAVAHQATQMYPFTAINTQMGAVATNGYQTRTIAPYQVIRRATTWKSGPFEFTAAETPAGMRVCVEKSCVDVPREPTETVDPLMRPLARHFSLPLPLPGDLPLAVHFRLFPDKLLQTQIQELALHDGTHRNDEIVREMLAASGAFVPNGATRLLDSKDLTPAQYLETVEFQIRQSVGHAAWLNQRFRPSLMQSYLPFPDETDHRWLGLDRAGDATARELRVWVYRALERAAQSFGAMAGKDDTLMFVSDHGMTPYRRILNAGAVLRGAGLNKQAAYLYYSILVNTKDWKSGSVDPREPVLRRVREALSAIRDPDSGEPVVTAFFTPAEHGQRYGIGGAASGDLYFDVLPGYSVSDLTNNDAIVEGTSKGTHGFLPSRKDMLAICIASGTAFRPGTTLPAIRSIQIAPMISEILGIGAPLNATGKSPLP